MIVSPLSSRVPLRGRGAWLAQRREGERLHAGVDLAGSPGDRVIAPVGGVVVLSSPAESAPRVGGWRWGGYGPGLVVIEGDDGFWHVLAHLAARPPVNVGDRVSAGDVVGELGELRTGAHLHWEVRKSFVPPPRLSIVEITISPAAYLSGVVTGYRPSMAAPENPGASLHTPSMFRGRAAPPVVQSGPVVPDGVDDDDLPTVPGGVVLPGSRDS